MLGPMGRGVRMLAVAAVVLSSCSGNGQDRETASTTASTEPELDSCGLLSEQEVSEATGSEVTGADTADDGRRCEYTFEDGLDGVSLSVTPENGAELFEQAQELFPEATSEISGLGDAAYWDSQLQSVNVLADDTTFSIAVQLIPVDPASEQMATTMARAVLGRL
ncbi:MAG: hypothetical protein JJLCMIEE_03226 [Acidimicrobiales bacterium]|nr:MAG: DUF3558 domain-containing protein [Actinomycetota bacterium]MBV6510106.1 hypothetical protein [Acidimicrobiales bacterium]RIK03598.1 MAG: hypothetical protein DCC48_16280 [Acidobacteriota bacterium]